MKVVDLEAHYYPPAFLAFLSKKRDYPKYNPESFHIQFREGYFVKNQKIFQHLTEPLETRAAFMDSQGVDVQILSISPGVELLGPAEAVEMARLANDYVYQATQRFPGRFYGLASLPVQDIEAARAELRRCIEELGFLGWNTFSNYGPSSPDEEAYRPIWALAAELKAPVYLHPTDPYGGRCTGLGPQLSAAALGFGVDTSITLMRLIYSGLLDQYPEQKIILGHLGEALPFTLERMDNRCRLDMGPPAKNSHLPSHYFRKNIYVTTSGQHSLPSFSCAREVLGLEHILFGSDYPYEAPEEVLDFRQKLPLSTDEKAFLYQKNAEALFGTRF